MNERIELLRDLAEFARISTLLSEEQYQEFKSYIREREFQARERTDRPVHVFVRGSERDDKERTSLASRVWEWVRQ